MSFGLGHGRTLDDAPGVVGVTGDELPSLPDEALDNARAGWVDLREWFSEPQRRLEVEIGSGKGAFLLDHGESHPEINLLGIEWAREFYLYTADRVRRRGLSNVRVLHGDATELFHWRVPESCVDVIHLYFSDPWPKARHHKKRVVQDRFLADVWRVLRASDDGESGQLRIVTDHPDYWTWIEEHVERWTTAAAWEALDAQRAGGGDEHGPFARREFQPVRSADSGELVGTNFERKYRREGRPFYSCVLSKRD